MNRKSDKRRQRTPRSQQGFIVTPVWKKDLDQARFARALLLLAVHLDVPNRSEDDRSSRATESTNGGGHDRSQ